MIIKKCERKDYVKTLEMLNAAFGKEGNWFENNMPLCVPFEEFATDEMIARHFIAVDGDKVIGCVGAYPFDLTVAENRTGGENFTFKAFGIGQVSCAAEARGRGVMSELLPAAIDEMTKNGAVIGFLGGDRFRYAHFGFDWATNKVRFEINAKRAPQTQSAEDFKAREACDGDIERLRELHEKLPARIARSSERWERLLKHQNYKCYIAENGGAYLIAAKEHGNVVELQGSGAENLLAWYARTCGHDWFAVDYPLVNKRGDGVFAVLDKIAASESILCDEMAAFFGVDKIWEELMPLFESAHIIREVTRLDELGRMALIKRLFGAFGRNLDPVLTEAADVEPLVFWIPEIDNI